MCRMCPCISSDGLIRFAAAQESALGRCCRKSHRKRTVELEFEINESWQAGCWIEIADLLVVLNQSYAVRPPKSFSTASVNRADLAMSATGPGLPSIAAMAF